MRAHGRRRRGRSWRSGVPQRSGHGWSERSRLRWITAVRAGVGMRRRRAVTAVADAGAAAVVMTYRNPVERYGVTRFATDLAGAGGSGAITPDLIPDEAAPWIAASDAYGLDRVFLVAPSSTDARLASTAAASASFVYAASTMGVTGARDTVGATGAHPRRAGSEPCRPSLRFGVGLGVSNGRQAEEVAQFADGVIVGSALVRCLLDSPDAAGICRARSARGRPGRRGAGSPPARAVVQSVSGRGQPADEPDGRAVLRRSGPGPCRTAGSPTTKPGTSAGILGRRSTADHRVFDVPGIANLADVRLPIVPQPKRSTPAAVANAVVENLAQRVGSGRPGARCRVQARRLRLPHA
mgnify:CR=1 FL=1